MNINRNVRRSLALTYTGMSLLGIVTLVSAHRQAPWPDLRVLSSYPNPSGDTCGPEGAASPESEKGKSNALKNRWKLPVGGKFEKLDFVSFSRLPLGQGDAAPKASDPTNGRAVFIEGYVKEVKPGGSRGESCNCNATGKSQIDAHIELVPDGSGPEVTDSTGKGMIVVEVTERSRRLAAAGLLSGSKAGQPGAIGLDWSTKHLRARLKGRRVRFAGWLYYDPDHHLESWKADPQDMRGRANWRETGWEIHPVMGIRVL